MSIEWSVVRRAMLTQGDLFPEDTNANCMSILISADQRDVAISCIKSFYQGLKWADELGIQGGYGMNRAFRQVFMIEDDYILGVFDNRNFAREDRSGLRMNPRNTFELLEFRRLGHGNIKTLIVLEKENLRLANSEAKCRQSKFLIDVVYPALAGIQAKFSGDRNGQQWYSTLSKAMRAPTLRPTLPEAAVPESSDLLAAHLLADIYHDPASVDMLLAEHSPLQLFCRVNSPLHLEFETTSASTRQISLKEFPNSLGPYTQHYTNNRLTLSI